MTLMALSLCIGLLIDDAIVVRENIVRHLGMGKDHLAAAREGTDEIGLAVMATTFAIVAVFVPIAFMSGIIGQFFFQFGITVAVAVLVSLFVSFTLDPMLSVGLARPAGLACFCAVPWLGRFMDRVESVVEWVHVVYGRLLEWAISDARHRLYVPVVGPLGRGADAAVERAQAPLGDDQQPRHRASDRGSDLLRQLRAPPVDRQGILAAGRRELHFAASQHAGRHEPRIHRWQGARGRGSAETLSRDRPGDDDRRDAGRAATTPGSTSS